MTKNAPAVRTFFLDRLKQFFSGRRLRHDIIDAVTDTENDDIETVFEAAAAIDEHKEDADFKDAVEALTRVLRISKKGHQDLAAQVDPSLFENPSEKKLYTAVNEVAAGAANRTVAENFAELRQLAPVITEYFDENMIMDKNEAVRNNRLAQLAIIARLARVMGNLNDLIVK